MARDLEACQINYWGSEFQARDFGGVQNWLWNCGRLRDAHAERRDRDLKKAFF